MRTLYCATSTNDIYAEGYHGQLDKREHIKDKQLQAICDTILDRASWRDGTL